MIEVLRLSHRIKRDPRVSSHCALVARALGASKMYYAGEKDISLETSVNDVVKRWGGDFSIEYVKNASSFIRDKKKDFKIVHLTMYGINLPEKIKELRGIKDILLVVGSKTVPIEFYNLSDYNIAISNTPHSEVAALSIFLHEFFQGKELLKDFKNSKVKIIPQEHGKKVKT